MVPPIDKEMEKLLKERHKLVYDFNTKTITKEEYDKKFNEFNSLINERCEIILKEIRNTKNNIPKSLGETVNKQTEETKMEEEVKVKKSRENSNAQLILNALQLKGTKTIDDVVKYVLSKKPEQKEKNVKGQGLSIIKMIKAKHKRFAKYTWDEATFNVIPVN